MEGSIQILTKAKLEEVLQVGKVDAGNGTMFGVATKRKPRTQGLTLVISSGGSGMSAIKAALQTANQKLTPDYTNYVKFIVVDSSTGEISEAKKQGIEILNISTQGDQERIQNRNTFYKQFVPADYDVTLLNPYGSSQNRMTGKIKLYDANGGKTNDEVLREMIENLFKNEWKAVANLPIDIMILTGISGGNGSGTFLDLAAQARSACPPTSAVSVYGYIMLPDTAERYANSAAAKNNLYRNGFAALKELESYMSIDLEADREEYFPSQVKANDVVINKTNRLYDFPVLISGDYDEAVSMIAETIVNSIADSEGKFEQKAFYGNNLEMRNVALSKSKMLDAGVLKPDACPEDSHMYCGIGYAQASIPEKIVIPNVISRINRRMYDKQEILGVESAKNAAFCTVKRRLDRVDFERQMRVLLNLDDRVKLDENSLCNKVLAILRAKGRLGQNNSELSRQDIVAGRTAEYIRNFNVEKTVTKAVPLFIEEIEKLYLDLERQARLVMNLYGPRAIEYLYEGKGNDNEKGVPEDYSDICLKKQIEVVASEFSKYAGTPGRYPRNLERKRGIIGNIVQGITRSDEDEWKGMAQKAAQLDVYCQISTKMTGMNGGWKKNYEDRVVRFKDCTVRFAQVLDMLMNYYTGVGSSLDSMDYREFASTSGGSNGVNLCSDSGVYSWVIDCVERKVNSVDIGAAKTALVTDFYENTEDWVSDAPGKARKAFDDVMSRIASIGKYSAATGGLDLTITDYFNEVLRDIDTTQHAVEIDNTVSDIMRRLLQSSAPSLATKGGIIGHINKVILVPRKLMTGAHGQDIERSFRKHISDGDTMAVSEVVDAVVCYQASVANALSDLKDLDLWEDGYEAARTAAGTMHLHNGEYVTLHMQSGHTQYRELTKTETDKLLMVRDNNAEPLSHEEDVIYGTGLSWQDHPSVNVRRYQNEFEGESTTSEGRYRREVFDKKIAEALRLGIIECEENNNVYKYWLNVIPKDWNNLDVRDYKLINNGAYVHGAMLFEYLHEQNMHSTAPYRKQIMLYKSEAFGAGGFDFNEIIQRDPQRWNQRVIDGTHLTYMKRIMRKATGLYQDMEDTLYKFYAVEQELKRDLFEKKVADALRFGIIEYEENNNVHEYWLNTIPEGWNNLEVRNYNQIKDGVLVRGAKLFEYLHEQNKHSTASYRKQIMIYNSETFGGGGFDFNEIPNREQWNQMAVDRTHCADMKRIMWKETDLYQEMEDTLNKFYAIDQELNKMQGSIVLSFRRKKFVENLAYGLIMTDESQCNWTILTDEGRNGTQKLNLISLDSRSKALLSDFDKMLLADGLELAIIYRKYSELIKNKILEEDSLDELRKVHITSMSVEEFDKLKDERIKLLQSAVDSYSKISDSTKKDLVEQSDDVCQLFETIEKVLPTLMV